MAQAETSKRRLHPSRRGSSVRYKQGLLAPGDRVNFIFLCVVNFRYESKGRQLAKSARPPNCPVGMNPALLTAQTNNQKKKDKKPAAPVIPGLPPTQTATKKKKKKPSQSEGEVKEVATKLAGFTIQEPTFNTPTAAAAAVKKSVQEAKAESAAGSTDPAKRLKNVKKKLRDIEALEEKLKSGELKNADKDQLEKIKRKAEVIKEIKDLEKIVK